MSEHDLRGAGAFPEASKQLLAERQLLCRIDSKYVVPADAVLALIAGLGAYYAALRVPSGNWAIYRSLYLDTPDLRCFHDHRRGRRVRHKVRIRHYPDRELSYLEVKTKRNEDVTDKARLSVDYGCELLRDRECEFLRRHVATDELRPIVRIEFRRMSLIALASDERVTIDVGVEAALPGAAASSLGGFAVIEVKQARLSAASPVVQRLATAGHQTRSLSKYVAAIARLFPDERKTRLLPDLRAADRIAR